jgi:hypothetical protein
MVAFARALALDPRERGGMGIRAKLSSYDVNHTHNCLI